LRYTKMHRGTHSPGFTVSPNKQRSPGALDDATAQCCLASCRVASRVRRAASGVAVGVPGLSPSPVRPLPRLS
jgi:hypothetical protein